VASDESEHLTKFLRDGAALDQAAILPLVYQQLRRLAQQQMSAERSGHTLQATALVHEAYLRLVGDQPVCWANRAHFFAAAAEAMRRILIERARRKAGPRLGGNRRRLDLDHVAVAVEDKHQELLVLDEALSELERHDEQVAQLVKLRYFVGMSHQEAADALGIGRRAADRLWAVGRAWLYQHLREQ
jgi:RNA polymerase sigma factor (TIGR02999 family)